MGRKAKLYASGKDRKYGRFALGESGRIRRIGSTRRPRQSWRWSSMPIRLGRWLSGHEKH